VELEAADQPFLFELTERQAASRSRQWIACIALRR
jgi:hypothetical protein